MVLSIVLEGSAMSAVLFENIDVSYYKIKTNRTDKSLKHSIGEEKFSLKLLWSLAVS